MCRNPYKYQIISNLEQKLTQLKKKQKLNTQRKQRRRVSPVAGAANGVLRSQVYTRTKTSMNTLKTRILTEIERELKDDIF
ncbi:hypothetical protein H5410_057781 [Solanum commersonii]|uniref:Uncharacterized protein n=1 Tax=Solanum commersonii TaxID=4109 RepID=A0A9J5WR00_SOLCO|nr:hypothetical protein H5410_057781 [Solanum commersonii]